MNKKYIGQNYRCAYCKKEYNSPITRANCELECFCKAEEHRAEAERRRQEEEKRLKMLRFEAEHAALEQQLGELLEKMYKHALESNMNAFRAVHHFGDEKVIFDIAL